MPFQKKEKYLLWFWTYAFINAITGLLFGRQLWLLGIIFLLINIRVAYQGWRTYFDSGNLFVWQILIISGILACLAGLYREHSSGIDILIVIAWIIYCATSFNILKTKNQQR